MERNSDYVNNLANPWKERDRQLLDAKAAYLRRHPELIDNMVAAEHAYRQDDLHSARKYVRDGVYATSPLGSDVGQFPKFAEGQFPEFSDHELYDLEDPAVIPDYPEDYVAGGAAVGAGLFQLGKGLTKWGLRRAGTKFRELPTATRQNMDKQIQQQIDLFQKGGKGGPIKPRTITVKKNDPADLRRAVGEMKHWNDKLDFIDDNPSWLPKKKPGAFDGMTPEETDRMFFHMFNSDESIRRALRFERRTPLLDRDSIHRQWDLRHHRWKNDGLHPADVDLGPLPGVPGEGAHLLEGLPEWLRRSGPPSANEIIPAAILYESMTE